MLLLGVHNGSDASAVLLVDGQLVEAVSEERFTRNKMQSGFPSRCIDYILSRHSLALSDIDFVTYGWYGKQEDPGTYARRLSRRIVSAMTENPDCGKVVIDRVDTEFVRDEQVRLEFINALTARGFSSDRIAFFDHHKCHAWSAFAFSPFDSALVFTFDGRGDLKSGAAYRAGTDSGLEELDALLSFDSLGFLYGQITHYLGFVPHRHEGKVTGLAAHGNPDTTLAFFDSLISWQDDTIRAHLQPYKPFYNDLHPDLVAELDKFSREDIAAGLQNHCENLVKRYISHWIDRVDSSIQHNICLAGGLFANVRINQEVAELPGVANVFVFPNMGDGGIPAGACALQHRKLGGGSKIPLPHVLLGPQFSGDEIEAALNACADAIRWEKLDNYVEHAISDLANGRVVGYFHGRMEFGPRALGARSILVQARDKSVNDWLNNRLHRTEFMPFAPVTPEELAHLCYLGWSPQDPCSLFMTRTFKCTDAFAERHPAVTHVDQTARPQTVNEARNGDYYRIVKGYCERTGDMALINTSFNVHEEPIVRSPADALDSLCRDMVDVLYLGPYRATLA